MRILLLEDDLILGAGLRDYLQSEEHRVDWCTTLSQARVVAEDPYDAWLVDWNLPDGSGLEWLRTQRLRGHEVPTLILTARDLIEDRVRGLDSGADDYVVKPFAPEELIARLRAITRRRAGNGQALRRFGSVAVDLLARSAHRDGHPVELTAREWAILEALVLRAGRLVSGSDLEAVVLGFDATLNSNSIAVHISRLRHKLGRDLVETVRGVGYRVGVPE